MALSPPIPWDGRVDRRTANAWETASISQCVVTVNWFFMEDGLMLGLYVTRGADGVETNWEWIQETADAEGESYSGDFTDTRWPWDELLTSSLLASTDPLALVMMLDAVRTETEVVASQIKSWLSVQPASALSETVLVQYAAQLQEGWVQRVDW